MTRLASRFGAANVIRRERPLTREELFRAVPSVFSEDKHASRSARYTYIPTISLLDSLQREGFQPFFACYAPHMRQRSVTSAFAIPILYGCREIFVPIISPWITAAAVRVLVL